MNDMRAIFRLIIGETGDRNLCGFQSTPRPNRLLFEAQRRDSPASPAPTNRVGRCATVRDSAPDAPDCPETFGRRPSRLCGSRAEDPSKASRIREFRERSRLAIQLLIGKFDQIVTAASKFGFRLVEQRGQSGTRRPIAKNSFPGGISIQFRDKLRQVRSEFAALLLGKSLYCRFDFLHCGHAGRLSGCARTRKSPIGGAP